jgi:glycosyltransferase involved in cell wall biosynthesis
LRRTPQVSQDDHRLKVRLAPHVNNLWKVLSMSVRPQFPDLLCFSHLRWNFVYQRPQHLMSRFARLTRVFYVEEAVYDSAVPRLNVTREGDVYVVTPHLPHGAPIEFEALQKPLLAAFLESHSVERPILWYYTPMALPLTPDVRPAAAVYDCMDELSAFAFAPSELQERERRLFRTVDLVFTGGHSLYRAKRRLHPRTYPFPSSVDASHFMRARDLAEPDDQVDIPAPRIGFFGVIDERMDLDLIAGLAAARPDRHFIFIGPIVKIPESSLPRGPNVHYLGTRAYADLPAYLAGWQVAMLPFARNEATRFISPTKVPEYLAAGLPVVSTSIPDVVSVFGKRGLVWIADSVPKFASAIELALRDDSGRRHEKVAEYLKETSWDRTWSQMRELLEETIRQRPERGVAVAPRPLSVPAVGSKAATSEAGHV